MSIPDLRVQRLRVEGLINRHTAQGKTPVELGI